MKRYFALVLAIVLATISGARAQGLDDQYVQIFSLIQEADGLSTSQPAVALAKYLEAQSALQQIQKGSPDWNPKLVSFRLNYVGMKIGALSTNPASTPAPPTTNVAPPTAGTNAPAQPAAAPNSEAQIRTLNDQVRQLQAERVIMEAKLKEALAMQPAAADPASLARAEEKVKTLQKENDLLKATIETEKSKPAASVDPKAMEQAQASLADSKQKLAQQQEIVSKLTVERDALLVRLKSPSSPDAAALQTENQLLKQRLAAATPAAQKSDGTGPQLSQAQAQIAVLQSEKEMLRLERVALENRLKQLGTNGVIVGGLSSQTETADASHVHQLERERDDLQKKLDAANKTLHGRKGNATAVHTQQLEYELAGARARLDVLEARQVPYTAEELALLKTPDTQVAQAEPKVRKHSKELPSGSTKLVTEAQTWFASRQFDKAESAYQQVVLLDQKNVPALANLAAIQIEAGHLDAAEQNVKTALAEDPDDPFSLYVLGVLRFRQTKYDDSFDALSRAAKLDPENAEIQNKLGLALAEKGLRAPAETALRKAVQLQPNYADAHYNLAIVYLGHQPPEVELARWHYQKSTALGHAHNAELEKKLSTKN